MTKRQLQQLLRHESFLKALAMRLVRDAARADDVVQETWLVALRSGKGPHEVQRGWLAGIVRNLVRRAHRDEQRRTRREKVAAREGLVAATDELAGAESFRRRMAQVVLDLPSHYREAILLRYYDELTPQAIGLRLGISASTVRTRLQRGLARLRQRLEVENSDARRAMLLVAALAFAPRRVPWARAAAAALLLAAGSLFLLPGSDARGREYARAPLAPDARVAATGAPREAATVADAPRKPTSERRTLVGVVKLPNGVLDIPVDVRLVSGGIERRAAVVGNRPFELPLDGLALPLLVKASHPETTAGTTTLVALRPVEITLRRRALVPTRLLAAARLRADAAGDRHGGAHASPAATDSTMLAAGHKRSITVRGIFHLADDLEPAAIMVEVCGPDGVCASKRVMPETPFRVEVDPGATLPRALIVRAAHPESLPAETELPVLVDTAGGGAFTRPFEMVLEPCVLLLGRVELEDGVPADGATVAVFALVDGAPAPAPAAAVTTDATGRYEVGVEPDAAHLIVAAAAGHRPVARMALAEMTLVLPHGVAIEGRAGTGRAVRAARTGEAPRTLALQNATLRWSAGDVAWQEVAVEADGRGDYVLGGLAEAEYEVELVDGGETQVVVAPGRADFVSGTGTLTVVVRDGSTPLRATLWIDADPTQANADGRAELALPTGTHTVVVQAPGFVEESRVVVVPGQAVFALEPVAVQGALLITLPVPAPPAVCNFYLKGDVAADSRAVELVDGRYLIENLEPDRYRITTGRTDYWFPNATIAVATAGATTPVTLDLRMGGKISAIARGPDDAPATEVDFFLASELAATAPRSSAAPFWTSELLRPGHYTLFAVPLNPTLHPTELNVRVVPGETLHVDVALPGEPR